MRSRNKFTTFLYQHFRKSGHTIDQVTIQPVEQIVYDINCTSSFKIKARHLAEFKWIKNLQSPFPLGLNDNIYQEGNISKNPDIDIFSILNIRKRKSRSHGIRRNGNIKRKSKVNISVADLDIILSNSGRHSMLSRLTSLSIQSLKKLDEEADQYVIQTDPFYTVSYLIQNYTQHVLRPHIDTQSDHDRHFLKIHFINKGIDFIDVPSIFRDRRVIDSVPKYFRNSEVPIICYKYKTPVRNVIFNYNKIVSDLDVQTNTPSYCECKNSKFCYSDAGHVITGNFDIIKDKRIRNLFFKGPKYRIPSTIDFHACRGHIAESIETFCVKWCRRENADPNALTSWKRSIFNIVDSRIKFYQTNEHLLPSKPKFTLRHLKKEIQEFHSKYVLVPADKAANNIIII
jgi:hypothetical protein